MKRIIIGIVVGIIVGASATYILVQSGSVSPYRPLLTQSKPIQDVPKMSVEAAETHRKSAYAELQTITEILALPTDFAQTEALYSLAGRSDSATVQGLIYQANQISNPMDRRGALQILFSRLTTLDPASALALARTPDYASNSQLEAVIWGEWSNNDFDNALIAAADLESDARRNNAAQGMYAAYGYTGNEKIAVIEDALGIRLDRNTKAQYLYALAARSPADAIAYINDQVSSQDQQTLTYWLADFLGKNDPEGARQYAALFLKKRHSDLFLRYIDSAAASTDPETMLENALADTATEQRTMKAYSALGMLALQDADKAMSYLSRARNLQERQYFATAIAKGLAETDPERALQWALEIDPADTLHVYQRVLSTIAREDPARAVNAVTSIQNTSKRNRSLMQVLSTIANTDPQLAASYLTQMDNKDVERHVTSNIARQWSRSDPEAAIEWVMTLEGPVRQQTLMQVGTILANYDVEAAIRLLPRLDNQSATNLRVQIVSQMATRGSVAEAQAFLAQYEGADDYTQMFSALVQATATVDYQSALQMTQSLPDGAERDGVLTQLAQQHVEVDPAESVSLISMISSQEQRSMTTSQLVRQWHRHDPDAAVAWARNLPRSEQRDSAIVGLAGAWDDVTPSRKMLLKSIGDVDQRQQAQLSVVYKVARTDPASAERLVLEFDFTDEYRQHAKQALQQSQMR